MIAALPLISTALSSLLGPTQAAGAATQVAGVAQSASSAGTGDSFSSLLASLSKDTVDKLKSSESLSVDGLQGKATTQSVVEAVMSAQESLQTALAVRDKAVAAFQDISRMSI